MKKTYSKPFERQGGKPGRSSTRKPFEPKGGKPGGSFGKKRFEPRDSKPERSSTIKPYETKGDKPAWSPGKKPFESRGDKPAWSSGKKPFESRGDKPAWSPGKKPFASRGEKPAWSPGKKPFESRGDKPRWSSAKKPYETKGGKPGRAFTGGGDGKWQKRDSYNAPSDQPMTVWDQAARWYDSVVGEEGSYYQREIVLPRTLELLKLKKGDRVLDLACGQGVFSRFLYSKNYKVEGMDLSAELIQFAKSRSDEAIKFHVGDSQSPAVLEGEKFDAVVCILAIQNIETLEPVFRNVARWLKPEGHFVMVMTHPCFRVPRQSHWGWDEDKKLEYRRVDLYATETPIPILTPPMAKSEVYTMTYHRPLESYFKALSNAGLAVDGLEEWVSNKVSEPGSRSRGENRARKEIPLFLALRVAPLHR